MDQFQTQLSGLSIYTIFEWSFQICSWCGQGFASKGIRISHERIHSGEKPYKCNFCDNKFAQRTSLNVHFQTHHKEFASDKTIKKYTFIKKTK